MEEDRWDKGSKHAVTMESNTIDHVYGDKMFAISVGNQVIWQKVAETYRCSDSQ